MTDSPGTFPAWLADHEAAPPPKQNKHARTTVGILSTIRLVGLIGFGLFALLTVLGTLASLNADQTHAILVLLGGGFALGMVALAGAVWYAAFSWFVETLNMLVQIAANTDRSITG